MVNYDADGNPFAHLDDLLREQGFEDLGGPQTDYDFDLSDDVDKIISKDLPEELHMTFVASAQVISANGAELEDIRGLRAEEFDPEVEAIAEDLVAAIDLDSLLDHSAGKGGGMSI